MRSMVFWSFLECPPSLPIHVRRNINGLEINFDPPKYSYHRYDNKTHQQQLIVPSYYLDMKSEIDNIRIRYSNEDVKSQTFKQVADYHSNVQYDITIS